MSNRLDIYLFQNGYLPSRQKASDAIKQGLVLVNGIPASKASYTVKADDAISVTESAEFMYVSRSALKLKHALEIWDINLKAAVCIDIGSSTGGFCQVMLEHGASQIFAIDTGTDQLHESLKNDERVTLFEQTDVRTWVPPEDAPINLVTIDVSFISITKIIDSVSKFFNKNTVGVFLIKPQYELEKDEPLSVYTNNNYEKLFMKIGDAFSACGLTITKTADSPITGKDGTKEFLVLVTKA